MRGMKIKNSVCRRRGNIDDRAEFWKHPRQVDGNEIKQTPPKLENNASHASIICGLERRLGWDACSLGTSDLTFMSKCRIHSPFRARGRSSFCPGGGRHFQSGLLLTARIHQSQSWWPLACHLPPVAHTQWPLRGR